MSKRTLITTHYLRLPTRCDFSPSESRNDAVAVERLHDPYAEFARFLYTTVGGNWYWVDRLEWSIAQWEDRLDTPTVEMWVGFHGPAPVGFYELELHADEAVEVVYLGVAPRFTKQGIGAALLESAVERGWSLGGECIWLHTCSLDSPAALPNYLARGFNVFRTESTVRELPDDTPGPWPGAYQDA